MDFLFRALFITAGVIAIGFALWFSLTLFAVLFIVGTGMVLIYALRDFLVKKDILNPTPGVPMDKSDATGTVIEGDYERVVPDDKKLK